MEQQSTIHKAVKTTNLGMVLPTLVAILLLLLLAVGSAKPLFNHFAGPFDITSEELVSINDPKDTFRTYVTVRPDFALDTTFYYYETQDDSSEKIIHSYYALQFGERLLLARYPGAANGDIRTPKPFTGRIVRLSDEEKTSVLQALVTEYPTLEGVFLPFLLDATGSGESVLPMIVGLLVLAGFVAWNLIKLFGSVANLSKHPVAKSLSRFGDWRQMAQEIDTQMAEPHETHGEFFHLTRDWLVYQSKTQFEAVPYRDLVWQYILPITYRSFGIATGKAYNLMVFDRCGKSRSLTLGKAGEAASDLQNKLQSHAPWSFSGYFVETETAWNREREKMIAVVEARKLAIENSRAEAQKAQHEANGLLENDSLEQPNADQVAVAGD